MKKSHLIPIIIGCLVLIFTSCKKETTEPTNKSHLKTAVDKYYWLDVTWNQ